ncbi:hypothetical protein I3760_05G041500 [Carya illinoinensis]|nr:hypothetical protein I3760_05G041500 [Carya illinoinensis]KAG2705202.1 hypothetical protein I3760_05G041500 [Carya illinoinensis]
MLRNEVAFDFWWSLTGTYSMCSIEIKNMGLLYNRNRHFNGAEAEENARDAEIERRIEEETKVEKHIQKLLLLASMEEKRRRP